MSMYAVLDTISPSPLRLQFLLVRTHHPASAVARLPRHLLPAVEEVHGCTEYLGGAELAVLLFQAL